MNMRELKLTRQFKKDLKRIKNDAKKISKLKEVLEILRKEGTLPKKYKPHMLSGDYYGFLECHVENDLLLIWIDKDERFIKLVRLGSHSELF